MLPVVVVVGPTATGKSQVALQIAAAYGGEIINSDALQVYRGFDIGTAKPSPSEQALVRHHLIDVLDPHEPYSAGQFARMAREASEDIRSRGRLPIIVGGSGLYIRALLQGISPLPPIDPKVRKQLGDELAAKGLHSLYEELCKADYETATNLHPSDGQRILRALEVLRSSGKPLSRWIRDRPFGTHKLDCCQVGLTLPRSVLYDRIAARVRAMIDRGWLAEVQQILSSGVRLSDPAFQALGYRQFGSHLRGEISLDEALAMTIQATRRFAKRQMTWFRKEQEISWFDAQEPQQVSDKIATHLEEQGYRLQLE